MQSGLLRTLQNPANKEAAMNTTKKDGYIEIKKAGDRFHTQIAWLDGNHSFSFGSHYDPTNTHHGLMLVNNEDYIEPMKGFSTHPHEDMEIVTWMLEGEVEHKDSMGNKGLIYPGLAPTKPTKVP